MAGVSGGEPWAHSVRSVALESLDEVWGRGYFSGRMARRLAFREFGTTLGLQVSSTTGTPFTLLDHAS